MNEDLRLALAALKIGKELEEEMGSLYELACSRVPRNQRRDATERMKRLKDRMKRLAKDRTAYPLLRSGCLETESRLAHAGRINSWPIEMGNATTTLPWYLDQLEGVVTGGD